MKFVEAVEDLAALNFKIDGLEITNKVIKQTDSKTVVLTTAAQEGGKNYTVTANDNKIGTFVGVSAVVPTGISVATKSLQGVIGKDVTVSATVTVPEGQSKAGVPVTFNIVNSNATTNDKVEAVAYTNAEGVASYTYTRYYASEDNVTAYATHKSSVYSQGKVYWANAEQLTIKEVTSVNSLANNDSKVYEINSAKNANKYVFVTFKENLNVTADKVVRTVGAKGSSTYYLANNNTISGTAEYPYEITTGSKAVIAVKLDPNGKSNLVLTGTNATVTPIVYEGVAVDGTDAGSIAGDLLTEFTDASYSATALQAQAPAVSFEAKHVLGLTIEAQGVANAATYKNADETGGRDYTVTYVDKDGKPAKAGNVVKIAIPVQSASNNVFLLDSDGNKVPGVTVGEYRVFDKAVTGNEGKVKFTVVSDYVTQFVEPTVYVDNGTGVGAKVGLDATDLQAKGAVTHFTDQVTYSTSLELVDAAGRAIKSVLANSAEKAYFQYETVDQNGKARAYRLADGTTAPTTLTYTVHAGTAPVTVVNGVGTTSTVSAGGTGQYNLVIPANSYSGALEVTAATATTASVYATATVAGLVLGTTDTVSATFTDTSVVNVNGTVTNVNKTTSVVHINNVPYSLAGATYLNQGTAVPTLSAFYDHLTVGKTVSVTKDTDGKLVFNIVQAPTPGASGLITKAEVKSPTTIDVTFSDAVTINDATQFWFDVNKNGVVDANETATGVTGTGTTHTFTITGATIASDIGEVVYTPALATADRMTTASGAVNDTITVGDSFTSIVAGNNALAFASSITGTPTATAGLGTVGTKQVETATLTATAGLGAGTFTVQFADGSGTTYAPITITTVLDESLPSAASKVVTALNTNSDFAAKYTASASGAQVIITAKTAAAEDTSLNLSVTDVNSGITPVATSTLANTPAAGSAAVALAQVGTPADAAGTFKKVAKVRVAQTSTTLGNFDKVVEVPVTGTPTAAQTATAIVTALNADTQFAARFTASVDTTVADVVVVTNKETGVVTATVIEVAN